MTNISLAAVARKQAMTDTPAEGELAQAISARGSRLPHLWPDQKLLYQTVGQGDDTILLNPDLVLEEEGQVLGLGLYDELVDNDPHLEGQMQTRVQAAISLPWEILPTDDATPEQETHAEVVRQVLYAIEDFEETRRRMLYGKLLKGFSVTELVWGGLDGYSAIVRMKDHDQRNWLFDVAWRARYIVEWNEPWKSPVVDPRRLLVLRHRAHAWNPYGRGIGRAVYYLATYKRFVTQFWATYCEKNATPTVDATIKGNAKNRIDEILAMAESAMQKEAVAHDEFVTLTTLESQRGGDTVAAFAQFIDMADNAESKAVVGQVLTSDARPTGLGSNTAQAHTGVRQDYLEFDALTLEEAMCWLAKLIVDANFGQQPANGYPRAVVHAEPPTDTGMIADTIDKAMNAGLDVPKSWAYQQLGIPEPKPGEEVLERAPSPFLPAFGAPGDNPTIGSGGEPVQPKIAGAVGSGAGNAAA